MNRKKWMPLAVLLAVVAALAAALLFLSSRPEEQADRLLDLNGEVETLAYVQDGASVALTKADGVWTLDSDPALPLDQDAVQDIADALMGLAVSRRLEMDPAELGFETPSMVFELTAGDGSAVITVGALNETAGAYYVRYGDTVCTVAEADLEGLCLTGRELYQSEPLTDRTVSDVTAMQMNELSFVKTDDVWTLADDPDYTLDQSKVKEMAHAVCSMEPGWTITAPEADEVYGLDAPDVTVTLTFTDGTTLTARFGASTAQDDTLCYFAADSTPEVVYEVAASAKDYYAFSRETLAGEETQTGSDDIIAENPVGGLSDYADAE